MVLKLLREDDDSKSIFKNTNKATKSSSTLAAQLP